MYGQRGAASNHGIACSVLGVSFVIVCVSVCCVCGWVLFLSPGLQNCKLSFGVRCKVTAWDNSSSLNLKGVVHEIEW